VTTTTFAAPAAILIPARVVHGFWFQPSTEGWVLSFTEDVTEMFGNRSRAATARFDALAFEPLVVPMTDIEQVNRLCTLCAGLQEELLLPAKGSDSRRMAILR
jgi:AraC family transcriptional regulator, transcriptional activator of pobA